MTLDQIWSAFITWEMGLCVVVWVLSVILFGIAFGDGTESVDGSNCFIFATLNSIFVLLLLKL